MKKIISSALAVSLIIGVLCSGIPISADNDTGITPLNTSSTIAIVLKIKRDIQPSVSLDGWKYGEKPNTPSVTGNDGDGDVTYYYKAKDADDSKYTTAVPTAAGNYTVKAEIAETDDYKSGSATADFTIENYSSTLTITLVIKDKMPYRITEFSATGTTAKVDIEHSDDASDGVLIIAVYGENNNLIGLSTEPVTKSDVSKTVTLGRVDGAKTAKAFIWDSLDKMEPLSDFVPAQFN